MRIGILALQGAFEKHAEVARSLGHEAVLVRSKADFEDLDGLILPGGESTVQLKLIDRFDLEWSLTRFAAAGKPILATCAGLILVARTVTQPEQRSFGFIDVHVARNAWGRQIDSFEAKADEGNLPLVFIRAPRILEVGEDVEVLARFRGEPVLVRQGNVTCATFHPELTNDPHVYRLAFRRSSAKGLPGFAPLGAGASAPHA
ncbi:pyridoxal 5'-phosphate synthase glutaminase subunit PdxT [Pendulispora albinea]|uniref:Pyridoxal 5'-phosphate synthase subunit PdxT n=1 Tax=Pendulispora albinea TaxID=2741071 RepID=A0ABZ2LPS9_9BACT